MVKKNYQQELPSKNTAKAIAANKRVSLKYSTEICREIKGKRADKAESFLNNIVKQKEFLPLRKYNKKVAHRKGQSRSLTKSGRYPKNCAKAFLELIGTAKANADYKGMDSENLLITHAFASKGFRRIGHQAQGRIGGKRRRKKSTHLEIAVREAS